MANYWRSGDGRIVIETTARWILAEAALRGLTVWDYINGCNTLAEMGVTVENAAKTLKPQIPTAHEHYNEHGGSSRVYHSWEEWFSHRLRNRIFYFFHKHGPESGTYRCLGEWPISVPPRPRAMAAE